MKTLTEKIKTKAIELGFTGVGIAKAETLTADAVRLREWLGRGYHGSMKWMEESSAKRTDPREIIPGARSIVAVAVNYYTGFPHKVSNDEGKISRYAWGDDYHILVTKRIQSLFDCIKQWEPESEGRYYVDTGPVMDKVWAERAGIGWRGKHTNLITKEFGSWVFLGEIITTLELEYDSPIEDFCGSCTACIDACPTGAIVEPYVLDAARCISYLTIEHRGDIDQAFAPAFDQWIFGCDICQDVCPWNKFQQETADKEFYPREDNLRPGLDDILSMTQDEFSRRYRQSPIKRTKLEGLKRNAAFVRR